MMLVVYCGCGRFRAEKDLSSGEWQVKDLTRGAKVIASGNHAAIELNKWLDERHPECEWRIGEWSL